MVHVVAGGKQGMNLAWPHTCCYYVYTCLGVIPLYMKIFMSATAGCYSLLSIV